MDYVFKIAIGDWSGDGHGKNDYHTYRTNKKIEDIREAYFSAINKLGKDYPREVCGDYQDSGVSKDMQDELKKKGFVFTRFEEEYEGKIFPYVDGMLELTEWFIQQGDSSIKLEAEDVEVDTLHFYGFDSKDRHIGFIGYGIY